MGARMDDHHDNQAEKAEQPSGQNGPGDQAKRQEAERKARAAKKLRENPARRKQQARRVARARRMKQMVCPPQKRTNRADKKHSSEI